MTPTQAHPPPLPPTHHIRTHKHTEKPLLIQCQREISYWINWKKFLFVRSLSLPHVVNRNFNSPLALFESFGNCSVPVGEAASANIHISVHEKCGIVQEIWCTEKERKTIRVLRNIVAAFFYNLFLINDIVDNASFPDISRCSKFGKERIKWNAPRIEY